MIFIGEVLVSEEVLDRKFVCNLTACKGACCWEGDYGAPLEDEEVPVLEEIYEQVKPYMTEAGRRVVEEQGVAVIYKDNNEFGTPLINGGACAFLVFDRGGVAKCAIEQAYLEGKTTYKKPISCHLYPIRVTRNRKVGYEALNYDEWDICSAACEKGEREKVPVYEFLREALVRRYGNEFYEELDAAARYLRD